MTDTNLFRISFGKHKGKPLKDIPLTYLDWLIGEKFMKEKFPNIKDIIEMYLSAPSTKKELEDELMEDELTEEVEY